MKAIFITDLHGRFDGLQKLPPAELLLAGGDITNFGDLDEVRWFAEMATARFPRVLAVAGNCDRPDAPAALAGAGVGLPREGVVLGGVRFFGISGAPFHHGATPFEWPDDEAAEWLPVAAADGLPAVLVTHAPPQGADTALLAGGFDAGSRAVAAAVRRLRPVLVLSGHIHEARGAAATACGAPTVNPGPFRSGHYAVLEFAPGLAPAVSLCTLGG